MILIAITEYSKSLVLPNQLKQLLVQNGFEAQVHIIYTNERYFDICATEHLKRLIAKADLILLFIQPYPLADWHDPFDTFFMMIYSFLYSHPLAKFKTTYVTPFVIRDRQNSQIVLDFMTEVANRAKAGHFALLPSDTKEFISNPPLIDRSQELFINRPRELVSLSTLSQLHEQIVSYCITKLRNHSQ